MTFEEKIEKAIESSEHKATDFAINYMSKDENNNEGFRRGAGWSRQETLREVMPSLKYIEEKLIMLVDEDCKYCLDPTGVYQESNKALLKIRELLNDV